ncbi:MAG: DUF2782 domain-containing protein [Arenicellales bacterium WSBS_2016_MAG_OTU3]
MTVKIFARLTLVSIVSTMVFAISHFAYAQNNGLEAPPSPPVLTDAEFSRYINEQSKQPQKTSEELTQEVQVEKITSAGQEVEIYSVGSRREVVRVKPRNGPEYYIVDGQGDGSFDKNLGVADKKPNQRMWRVFKW